MKSRFLWLWLTCLALWGCEAEMGRRVPPTQVVVASGRPLVRKALSALRVRTHGEQGSDWGLRDERTFDQKVLRWPVEESSSSRATPSPTTSSSWRRRSTGTGACWSRRAR